MTKEEFDAALRSLWPVHSLTEIARALGTTRGRVAGRLRRLDLLGTPGAYKREEAAKRIGNRGKARGYDERKLTERWTDRRKRNADQRGHGTS